MTLVQLFKMWYFIRKKIKLNYPFEKRKGDKSMGFWKQFFLELEPFLFPIVFGKFTIELLLKKMLE